MRSVNETAGLFADGLKQKVPQLTFPYAFAPSYRLVQPRHLRIPFPVAFMSVRTSCRIRLLTS